MYNRSTLSWHEHIAGCQRATLVIDQEADMEAREHQQIDIYEFAFRHNRRENGGVGLVVARVLESLVLRLPLPMGKLMGDTPPRRRFVPAKAEQA